MEKYLVPAVLVRASICPARRPLRADGMLEKTKGSKAHMNLLSALARYLGSVKNIDFALKEGIRMRLAMPSRCCCLLCLGAVKSSNERDDSSPFYYQRPSSDYKLNHWHVWNSSLRAALWAKISTSSCKNVIARYIAHTHNTDAPCVCVDENKFKCTHASHSWNGSWCRVMIPLRINRCGAGARWEFQCERTHYQEAFANGIKNLKWMHTPPDLIDDIQLPHSIQFPFYRVFQNFSTRCLNYQTKFIHLMSDRTWQSLKSVGFDIVIKN